MSGYFSDPEKVEIWSAQAHLWPIGCFEMAQLRTLGACHLLSAQRAEQDASAIFDDQVDQTARKRGIA